MKYQDLKKIYYKDSKSHEKAYQLRYSAPFTEHLNFTVHQYNYDSNYPGFYCYTQEIVCLLDEIYSKCMSLYTLLPNIPEAGIIQYLHNLLIQEIKSSNAIEGVRSTRREISNAMNQRNPSKYVRLWGIVNKYEKIINNEIITLNEPMDIRLLFNDFLYKEIERDDPENLPDGKLFRKRSVDIVTATNKTVHRGVLPEEEIIKRMQYALDILHSKEFPRLVRLAIFHYMFVYIHPFYDGNGRMVRFITSYMLAKEIHPTIALRLSLLIKKNNKKYYDAFALSENNYNRGDFTPFITYSLELILEAVNSTIATLNGKLKQLTQYRKLLPKLSGKDNTLLSVCDILLQATIFSSYGASIDEITNTIEKTRKTVQKRIDILPKHLLRINNSSKPYRYRFNKTVLDTYLNDIQ